MKRVSLFVTLCLGALSALADCPAGFAPVPALSPYSGQTYCVMQNEAVNPATGAAWNYVSEAVAAQLCVDLVPQGNLPVNALWQAIVRQGASVAGNWTGGSVGSGALKTDLTLSNGSTFYDIGDSLWEFVIGTSPADFYATEVWKFGSGSDPNNGVNFTINGIYGDDVVHFGLGSGYSASSGLGYAMNRSSVHIMRGGDDSEPGAFGVAMNHNGEAASDAGFRCSCPLSACGN